MITITLNSALGIKETNVRWADVSGLEFVDLIPFSLYIEAEGTDIDGIFIAHDNETFYRLNESIDSHLDIGYELFIVQVSPRQVFFIVPERAVIRFV